MKVALIRVGIDTGSGGIHGPIFQDGTFEYVPIPDGFNVDERTYGGWVGRKGRPLVEYFPQTWQHRVNDQSMHLDPEFETFTYGDPTGPKAGLRRLERGDLLVFYSGLKGWDHASEAALYLIGYFEVDVAGRATEFSKAEIAGLFSDNFHVRNARIYREQREKLVLVKGGMGSRILQKAHKISAKGRDRSGRPLKVLSDEMQAVFGDFDGKISIQRSPTRWVHERFTQSAAEFVRSLE